MVIMTVTNEATKMAMRTAVTIMIHAIVPSMKTIIVTHANTMITHTKVVTATAVAMTGK